MELLNIQLDKPKLVIQPKIDIEALMQSLGSSKPGTLSLPEQPHQDQTLESKVDYLMQLTKQQSQTIN
jgi:hypothetical protein